MCSAHHGHHCAFPHTSRIHISNNWIDNSISIVMNSNDVVAILTLSAIVSFLLSMVPRMVFWLNNGVDFCCIQIWIRARQTFYAIHFHQLNCEINFYTQSIRQRNMLSHHFYSRLMAIYHLNAGCEEEKHH